MHAILNDMACMEDNLLSGDPKDTGEVVGLEGVAITAATIRYQRKKKRWRSCETRRQKEEKR